MSSDVSRPGCKLCQNPRYWPKTGTPDGTFTCPACKRKYRRTAPTAQRDQLLSDLLGTDAKGIIFAASRRRGRPLKPV